MASNVPDAWMPIVGDELEQPYFQQLQQFVRAERRNHTVYPPESDVYNALKLTPYDHVRVLLLGQDPYHDENQAHGLCFSVRPGVAPPPSLRNIFKELHDDLGCYIPNNGYLVKWAEQGVLMLNAVLTVRAHAPNSHRGQGWERFTDRIIQAFGARPDPVVFVLWGGYARKKTTLIDTERNPVIQSAHPSPLAANRGFFGSKSFSRVNAALRANGIPEIDWQIEDM